MDEAVAFPARLGLLQLVPKEKKVHGAEQKSRSEEGEKRGRRERKRGLYALLSWCVCVSPLYLTAILYNISTIEREKPIFESAPIVFGGQNKLFLIRFADPA